jgi:curved DNA-binding protein CbpA
LLTRWLRSTCVLTRDPDTRRVNHDHPSVQGGPVMGTIERSLYELLGVPESADAKQLTAAFRRLAKEWHPDVNQDRLEQATERIQKISGAYQILKDPARRTAYDLVLQAERHSRMGTAGHPTAMTEGSSREAWWAPPAGSPVATVIKNPAPPSAFPTPSRNRHLRLVRMGCFARSKPAVRGLGGHITRTAWLVGSAILCLVSGAFLLFLVGAHGAGKKDLARWGGFYAFSPIFWGIDQVSPSPMAATGGVLLVLAGTAHVFRWRRRLYAATTGRAWDA